MTFENRRPGPGGGLRRLATRVSSTRARQRDGATTGGAPDGSDTPDMVGGSPRPPARPDPVLRWKDPSRSPDGDFSACAVPNGQLRVHAIPEKGDPWDVVSSFSLSYDGYAYWDDVSELATRHIRDWTRHRALPTSIDEVRACLFYEQRRWHHFGEEPNGRAALYVWALLDALQNLIAARVTADGPPPEQPETTLISVRTRPGIRSFLDDDAGYLEWASQHRGGFVVNADRTLSPNSLMLHRATCSCIGGPAGSGRTRTANYRKVCASDVQALVEWCRNDIGTDPACCRHCRPWP